MKIPKTKMIDYFKVLAFQVIHVYSFFQGSSIDRAGFQHLDLSDIKVNDQETSIEHC